MTRYCRFLPLLVFSFLAFSPPAVMEAQGRSHTLNLGATYTYVHTNLVPGCNCFGMQGGSAEVQYSLSQRLSLLGALTVTHRDGITRENYSLTQGVFSGGLRYAPLHTRVRPYGDLLLGGAHTSGSLSPSNTGYGSASAFALQSGGGVLLPLSSHWTLKPIEIHYLLTTFANGANNKQNDFTISSGVLFHIHRRWR